MIFANRQEAGVLLAKQVAPFLVPSAMVCAIARGGVVVGFQIAQKLHVPLIPIVVKKLRAPSNPELAIGAITRDGIKYIDWELALKVGTDQDYLDNEIRYREKEVQEGIKKYRRSKEKDLGNDVQQVILVDDGIATGATVYVVLKLLLEKGIKNIVLAVPVVAKDIFGALQSKVDRVVALKVPDHLTSVGAFYKSFPQVMDGEVIKLLASRN